MAFGLHDISLQENEEHNGSVILIFFIFFLVLLSSRGHYFGISKR